MQKPMLLDSLLSFEEVVMQPTLARKGKEGSTGGSVTWRLGRGNTLVQYFLLSILQGIYSFNIYIVERRRTLCCCARSVLVAYALRWGSAIKDIPRTLCVEFFLRCLHGVSAVSTQTPRLCSRQVHLEMSLLQGGTQ